jgi:hypothetical protein
MKPNSLGESLISAGMCSFFGSLAQGAILMGLLAIGLM